MKKLFLVALLAVGAYADMVRDGNIVQDTSTGLVWQDTEDNITVKKSWSDAITYCEELVLDGYEDWRLPNRSELISLTDKSIYNPSIKPMINYISTDISYWTSSTDAYSSRYAWGIDFSNGQADYSDKSDSVYVRCVR
jgi:hypothetical protein